ncbi:MAG: hypothetical protein HGB03_00895 [Candidatus Yonathbacteria bacterium]|nr:hypothetical protein [Candidatus Yonathbacteria bacterium]NTW47820.1 hypothetical protein [Candidatus Yonathbacteria bacterium]
MISPDFNIVYAFFSMACIIAGAVPYVRDMLKGKTKPHTYSWFVWFLTTGIATIGSWYGGGGWGAVSMIVFSGIIGLNFVLSLRFGTRDITRTDTVALIVALFAIVLWIVLDDPLWSVLLATAIDIIGYIPTIRKTWFDPSSETPSAWLLSIIGDMFALLALSAYNVLTVTYLVAIIIVNIIVFLIAIMGKKTVSAT